MNFLQVSDFFHYFCTYNALYMIKTDKMSISIHRLYGLWVMLLVSLVASAQRFVNVALEGGQTICSITQDEQGLMWIGTDNGLFSYDGYHGYRHYVDHAFSNTRVNALAVEKNILYMATANGVLQFDMHADVYVKNTVVESYQDETKRKTIKELRVLDMKNKKASYGSEVYALLHTPKGTLVGSLSGLYLGKRLVPLRAGAQPLVNALYYDQQRQCYWIGTEGALYCADLQLQNFSKIEELNGNSVKCLAEDAEGKLYIGTDNGLFSLSINNVIEHYVHDSRDAASIPNNIVWACFVDKWQNVWIGTDNGLSRLSTHTYYTYTPLDKVTFTGEGNCLHAIIQTKDGDWWLGGTNGLIRQGNVWYKQNNKNYPLTHNRVRKIYEDHDGDVWVCTDHGINLFNRATQQMMNFIVYDKTGKYSTTWAYDIVQDKDGKMWMASYNGGIFVMDKSRLKAAIYKDAAPTAWGTATCIADYHFSDQGKNALSGLHIGQLVVDGNGNIWASSYNRLDCINPKNMVVLHPTNSEVINYLMCDKMGNIWVGNNSEVKCYFATIPLQGAKFDPKIWKIGGKVSTMCDVEGKVWVITGNECCIIDPAGESSRFMIPSITPLTAYYSPITHEVVMGGNDGFVTLRADMTKPKGKLPQLLLAGITVNGKPMQEVMLGEEMDADDAIAPRYMKKLELKSDENNFTLHLTDLPFSDHPSGVYAYKLEGSDNDWHFLKSSQIDIAYNGLSYGNYRLTVHLVDGEGNVGEEVYALDVSVLPPWYLSLWCKIFYVTALIVFIAWLVSFYFLRKELAEEQRQKAEIVDQVNARMDFYKRLSQSLRTAVEHQSFVEVTDLINKMLDVDAEPVQVAVVNPLTTGEKETAKLVAIQDNSGQEQEMDEADRKLLDEITQAIEKNMIDSDFNVTKLQEVIGIGGKQLYRKLKALTGHTPVEYIRDMRMRKAAKLLSAGKFSVSEVMYTVGFSNSSYFSKCFSKTYGMTPTEFMKKS